MNTRALLANGLFSLAIISAAATAQQTLLIVTPDEFVDELEPLVRFKNASARPTYMLSLSQIDTQFSDPSWDAAERVKRCIAYYEQNHGVGHVLLAGDVDKVPVRWRWWGRWMPDDPYLEGDWRVIDPPGVYRQLDANANEPYKAYCSWVDVGPHSEYTVEVDCRLISGDPTARQIRIYFADAETVNSGYRVELRSTTMELWTCGDFHATGHTLDLTATHHVTIELGPTAVNVWIDGSWRDSQVWNNIDPVNPGKIGLGTYRAVVEFDNFVVTTDGGATVLWSEDFNDRLAQGFHRTNTMFEWNWAISELYYADLYDFIPGPVTFDDWDLDGNGLYGEIEWNPDPSGCSPNCKTLNNDRVDLLPDVRVGRVPASTSAELSRYVGKVLAYELRTTRDAGWFKRAVLYEGSIGYGYINDTIESALSPQPSPGFSVVNRHWASELQPLSDQQRRTLVTSDFNQGAGFVNYLGGHGNVDEWSCLAFRDSEVKNDLTNVGQWPVVFAATCLTGKLGPQPPWDGYRDIDGHDHAGSTNDCETLPAVPATEAPLPIQVQHDSDCIAEDFLFNAGVPGGSRAGAIAYLGERTAGRHWGEYLSQYFFLAYSEDITVGDMWKIMMEEYYNRPDPSRPSVSLADAENWVYGPELWDEGHLLDEPQKFVLFGDPSLVLGGAFNLNRSGVMWDFDPASNGPWLSFVRYRVTGAVTVPSASTLTVHPGASVLVENGNQIVGLGTGATEGFHVLASTEAPVYLLAEPPGAEISEPVRGMKVTGEIRCRHGGGVRMY